MDVLYHASCYAVYVSPRASQQKLQMKVSSENARHYYEARTRAFDSLVKHIEKTIVQCPGTVTDMTEICALYVQIMQQQGVDVESYRAYLLKARLLSRFGDSLSFHRPRKRKVTEFVFNSKVPAGPLVEKCSLAIAVATAEHDAEDAFSASNSDSSVQESGSGSRCLLCCAVLADRNFLNAEYRPVSSRTR